MVTDIAQWLGAESFINPTKRLYWLFLLSSFLIALIFAYYKKTGQEWLSKEIWWHRSARLDYQYYVLISLIKSLLIYPFVISVTETTHITLQLLISLFDYQETLYLTHWIIVTLYTASLFLFSDFTRYWLHRLLHKSELLWAFHQVHHSAEVLTPITFYRVHPVESVLFGFRYALSTGFVTGIFLYLFGAQLSLFDILGVNALHFIALFIGSNLRHSPVPLAYYHWLEHWFISPKQHQQHHTPAYSNKNFGGVLAIWDTLFNTLQTNSNLPSNIKVYGLKAEESLRLHSIKDLLFKPFISIIRQRKSF